MGPLDLTKHPPRSASVAVDDIAYFPRVIDKIRAEFEGGHLGAYVVLGPDGTSGKTVTARFYRATGVVHDELVEAVKAATDDASVAAWLRRRVGAAAISKWNAEFRGTRLGDLKKLLGDRLYSVYPIARELPDGTSLAELLDADDLIVFPDHTVR